MLYIVFMTLFSFSFFVVYTTLLNLKIEVPSDKKKKKLILVSK